MNLMINMGYIKTPQQRQFIYRTATDYDMDYSDVLNIYNRFFDSNDSTLFYEKLEEFIKQI